MEANDLIDLVEGQLSAPTKELLKREDEARLVYEAHQRPKFVEDVVRDVVAMLRADPRVFSFQVGCESLESIHNHTVYAFQEEGKTSPAGPGEAEPSSWQSG